MNLRPLNIPVAIRVEEDIHHRPRVLEQKGRKIIVASIDDLWQIHEEWWRERPIARMYYQLTAQDGDCITIFRDLVDGLWYRQGG